MRFQVPQFVDIEDKIIGPLTLKQFLVYVVAVLLLIPVFLRSDVSLFLTIAIPIMGTAALFAHFRWHGKSLFVLFINVVQFYGRGSRFIWRRTGSEAPFKIGHETQQRWADAALLSDEAAQSRLQAVARQLETEGNVSQVDEADPLAPPA